MEVKFDQHFLKDDFYLDLIIDSADLGEDEVVFEIGPGQGDLTKKMLPLCSKVICCELDRKNLFSYLDRIDKNSDNFQLIWGNGLEKFSEVSFDKLIANIPYSITEPLYKKILDSDLKFAVILHGIDFYRNISERVTRWSFFVNAFFDVELVDEVEGSEFTPATKVKSAIVRLIRKDELDLSDNDKFLIEVWKKRDRSVKNCLIFALVDGFNLTKKEAKAKVLDLDLSDDVLSGKFEQVSNNDLVYVFDNLLE